MREQESLEKVGVSVIMVVSPKQLVVAAVLVAVVFVEINNSSNTYLHETKAKRKLNVSMIQPPETSKNTFLSATDGD